MEILEVFKNNWSKEDLIHNNFSYDEIRDFIRNDSKSIVKRIYTTSVIEFCFWLLINLYINYTSIDPISQVILSKILELLSLINYLVLIYFIFKFYIIKKHISYCNNTKSFLFKILKLIKIANNYIIYNMIVAGVSVLIAGLELLAVNPNHFKSVIEVVALVVSLIISTGLILLILHLLYKFLYGRFLKRLQENYNELNSNFN